MPATRRVAENLAASFSHRCALPVLSAPRPSGPAEGTKYRPSRTKLRTLWGRFQPFSISHMTQSVSFRIGMEAASIWLVRG